MWPMNELLIVGGAGALCWAWFSLGALLARRPVETARRRITGRLSWR